MHGQLDPCPAMPPHAGKGLPPIPTSFLHYKYDELVGIEEGLVEEISLGPPSSWDLSSSTESEAPSPEEGGQGEAWEATAEYWEEVAQDRREKRRAS